MMAMCNHKLSEVYADLDEKYDSIVVDPNNISSGMSKNKFLHMLLPYRKLYLMNKPSFLNEAEINELKYYDLIEFLPEEPSDIGRETKRLRSRYYDLLEESSEDLNDNIDDFDGFKEDFAWGLAFAVRHEAALAITENKELYNTFLLEGESGLENERWTEIEKFVSSCDLSSYSGRELVTLRRNPGEMMADLEEISSSNEFYDKVYSAEKNRRRAKLMVSYFLLLVWPLIATIIKPEYGALALGAGIVVREMLTDLISDYLISFLKIFHSSGEFHREVFH